MTCTGSTAGLPSLGVALQVLEGLHAKSHYLGVLQPDRITVLPNVYLLELTAGAILPIP